MGGLGFGQGSFGQYATGGTVPPDFPAIEDVIILVRADIDTVTPPADVDTVLVPAGTL